jgi:hypothetical protein
MGCLLGCFEKITPNEPKILNKNYNCVYSESDFYIDYYLATRFDLWD